MMYAIFDGEFVEVNSMYKKTNGTPTYYSIWVIDSRGEFYAKNYDTEEQRDGAWDFILKTMVRKKQKGEDVFIDFTTDSHFISVLEEE